MAEQEKVDDPLRGLYRQLGIPLAGEGEFVDVKPNVEIRPWPGVFDRIRESFDPEYAKAKRLAYTQQGMLQDIILSTQAFKAMQSTQIPTVGEAQALYPGFPVPPQAIKTIPQAPLQSDEMSVLQGTQQVQVPSKMQGPMPGVMTALGEFTQRQLDDDGRAGLSMDQNMGLDERDPYLYEEAPRPMRTIDVGQYGPDMAPSQATVMDPTTKLPPAFQAQLAAQIHQTSLKQTQPHYPSADEIKYKHAVELGTLAWKEQNPGKEPSAQDLYDIQQIAAGGFEKNARPGSSKARIDAAKAAQEEAVAGVASEKAIADLAHVKAGTRYTEAQTTEIQTLLDAKLQKLLAEAEAAHAVGSKESIGAYYKEQQALLGQAKAFIDMAQEGRKGKTLSDESYAKLMDLGLESLSAGVKAEATNRSWLEKTFGSKTPVDLTPRPESDVPRRLTPPGIPYTNMTPAPSTQAPTLETDPKAQQQAEALALYRSMKEGEVRTFRGEKFRKKGGKLEKVK